MNRKLFILFFMLLGISVSAQEFVRVGCIEYRLSIKKGTATVEKVDCSDSVELPSSVTYNKTYPVTEIGNRACYGNKNLKSVIIPNSVINIGNHAFDGCKGLVNVIIPNSVINIGNHAFDGCKGLVNVIIPNSVTEIDQYAFAGCSGLKSIEIPNSVKYIGSYAFSGCTGLTSITIPESLTSIDVYTFYRCINLENVTIPSSVQRIGENAFYDVPLVIYSGLATGSPWGAKNFLKTSLSQYVSNVASLQAGRAIEITYDLDKDALITSYVKYKGVDANYKGASMTSDGYSVRRLDSVTGDVGLVKAGKGKKIVWNVLDDYPEGFIHDEVHFIITTTKP